MAVYIFLLIGTILIGIPLCSQKCGRSGKIIYCCAAAAAFTFISALRFRVGYDFDLYGQTYFDMTYMIPEEIAQLKMEKGFLMPLYVLGLELDNYSTVFVYTSLLIYPAVFFLIYKNSTCPWVSAAVYLCFGMFFNSLCFVRQVIAALIAAYAMKYSDEKFSAKYFIIILSASVFHWSALIMIPLFWLLKIKPGYVHLGVISVLTVIFCIFSRSFITWAADSFYMYNIYDPETHPEAAVGLSPKFTIMFGIAFVLCFIFRKRLEEINPKNSIYINCLMYAVVFEAMGMRHAVLSRFSIIVYITPLLYMSPDLAQVIREYFEDIFFKKDRTLAKKYNIAAMSILSLYCVGSYVMLMAGNYNGVVPYESRINKPDDVYFKVLETDDEYDDEFLDDEEYDEEYSDEFDEDETNEMIDELLDAV